MQHQKWKTIHKQDVSPSKWFPVSKEEVELPSGKRIDYYKSELANVSMIVPITKNKEVVFVKQYKHGIGEVCLEFPAGRIENGKTATEAAAAELLEETGIVVAQAALTELIELWTEPSKSSVRVFGFLATNVEITQKQELEETELIEIITVPLSQLDTFIAQGEIHGSDTLALLLFTKMQFPELFV